MEISGRARTWVKSIAAGFLCVAAGVTFAMAGAHPAPQPQAQAKSGPEYVPPGMHEAQAGEDVGPGSDEAQLVGSSWGE